MIILGIDPGIRKENPAGWAVYRGDSADILACGVLPPPAALSWERRIEWVAREVPPLLSRYAVSYVACEDAYQGVNAQTYRQLVAFGWEMRVVARETGCPFVLVSPADQARTLKSIPRALLDAATQRVPERHRPHAKSAIAIAWHGAGLLQRRALEAR